MNRYARVSAALLPYIAVAIGMHVLGSAWAALGIYHVGMLITILVAGSISTRRVAHAVPEWIYLTPIVFALGGLALYLLWPFLGDGSTVVPARLADFGIDKRSLPVFAIYFCFANAIFEEIFWRGRLGSDRIGLHPNDLLFGGYHGMVMAAFAAPVWIIPVVAAAVFAGWLWRMIRKASGGLAIPIMTHIAADVSIVIAVFARLYGIM